MAKGNGANLGFGLLLDALGGTAEKAEPVFRFHCRLIAAPSQCHIQRLAGKLLALRQCRTAVTHANGKGDVHAVVDTNLPCLVQHMEPVVHDLVQIAGFHYRIEQVVFYLADNALCPLHKVFQHPFHLGGNLCLFAFSGVLQQIVIAVDHQQHYAGTGVGLLVLQPQNICDFQKLHRNDFLLVLGTGNSMHPIAQPVVLH